jgi:hypothetical protein
MTCPEYLRLREDYEMALRRWSRVALFDAVTSIEIKQQAYEERDGAKGKLDRHRESCPICFKDRWKTFDTLRKRL